jgi:hypothetical protein
MRAAENVAERNHWKRAKKFLSGGVPVSDPTDCWQKRKLAGSATGVPNKLMQRRLARDTVALRS